MNERLIERLLHSSQLPSSFKHPRLVETHISFVLLGRSLAYKFKKDVRFSFLDFSSLAKRKYYCEREVMLNNRMTSGVYLGVVPVRKTSDGITVDGPAEGKIIDYAIRMKRLRSDRQMHVLLEKNRVTRQHILVLADLIRDFHQRAEIVQIPVDVKEMASRFKDIRSIIPFVRKTLGMKTVTAIRHACRVADRFLKEHQDLLQHRMDYRFVRDVHGDFHSRNIFLYAKPIIFDCIEFNDAYRQLDILDELAFFCMDLEAEGHVDLSRVFLRRYFDGTNGFGKQERQLFRYYKAYRANVRAKVSALHAMEPDEPLKDVKVLEVKKYLRLMEKYLQGL